MLSPHKSWDDGSGRSQELADLSPSRHEFDLYRLTLRGGLTGLTGFDSLTAGQRGDSLLDLDEVGWLVKPGSQYNVGAYVPSV